MAFIHTWKITKVQKFGSKTILNTDGNTYTSYTDLICGVWGTLRTTNDNEEFSGEEYCLEKTFNWQWENSPIDMLDPEGFIPFADLTEQDYVNIMKANGMNGVEKILEHNFQSKFVSEPIDTIDDPYGYSVPLD